MDPTVYNLMGFGPALQIETRQKLQQNAGLRSKIGKESNAAANCPDQPIQIAQITNM